MDTSSPANNDTISDALDIVPIEEFEVVDKKESMAADANDDYDIARGNMVNIIEKGNEALDDMLAFAQQSQHPRGFEVVATLIKTLADANKDLMELAKRRKELNSDSGPSTVNNNLFVGSTTDLLKMLRSNGK